jgi:hypothetical protein
MTLGEIDVIIEIHRTDRVLLFAGEIYNEKKKQTIQSKLVVFLMNTCPCPLSIAQLYSTSYSQSSPEEREIGDPVSIESSSSSQISGSRRQAFCRPSVLLVCMLMVSIRSTILVFTFSI